MIKSYATVLEYVGDNQVLVELNLNGKVKKFLRSIRKINGQTYVIVLGNEYLI
ncbi:MAG: hypothetical protein ACRC0G_05405 [Fusobacteriaceae bacterium]